MKYSAAILLALAAVATAAPADTDTKDTDTDTDTDTTTTNTLTNPPAHPTVEIKLYLQTNDPKPQIVPVTVKTDNKLTNKFPAPYKGIKKIEYQHHASDMDFPDSLGNPGTKDEDHIKKRRPLPANVDLSSQVKRATTTATKSDATATAQYISVPEHIFYTCEVNVTYKDTGSKIQTNYISLNALEPSYTFGELDAPRLPVVWGGSVDVVGIDCIETRRKSDSKASNAIGTSGANAPNSLGVRAFIEDPSRIGSDV
jgi:hypothetical protein